MANVIDELKKSQGYGRQKQNSIAATPEKHVTGDQDRNAQPLLRRARAIANDASCQLAMLFLLYARRGVELGAVRDL